MGSRPNLKEPDTFTLEEVCSLSPRSMTKIILQMSPEHKAELMSECEMRIRVAEAQGSAVGHEWADYRGVTRFPSPYVLAKKYTYIYTCLAGWFTEADLEARAQEKFEREGITQAQADDLVRKMYEPKYDAEPED